MSKGVLMAPAGMANLPHMTLETRMEPNYLRAIARGVFEFRDAKHQFVELLHKIVDHSADRILFDGRLVNGNLDVFERYLYGDFVGQAQAFLPASTVRNPPKFAYVLQHPVLDPDRLGETVARNRGMSVRAFDNKEEAVEWLMSEKR